MPDRDEVVRGLRTLALLLQVDPDIPTPSGVAAHVWAAPGTDLVPILAALRPDPPSSFRGETFAMWRRELAPGVSYHLYTEARDVLMDPPPTEYRPAVRPELLAAARGEVQPVLSEQP